jgi:hypothetical protein
MDYISSEPNTEYLQRNLIPRRSSYQSSARITYNIDHPLLRFGLVAAENRNDHIQRHSFPAILSWG